MTLTFHEVDFLQFEGHLSVIEVKTQNAGRAIHINIISINRTVLTKLHEIGAF